MQEIYIPTNTFGDGTDCRSVLLELIVADQATYSPREKQMIDYASEYGEIYPGRVEMHPDSKSYTVYTDMGQEDTNISVTFPAYCDLKTAVKSIGKMIDFLMENGI